MKKSEQIEEIGSAISECLNKLYETEEQLSFNPFPKMYHPTEDSLNISLIVDGNKIIIEVKSVLEYNMWKQIKSNTKTFQLGDEPELIHIIKTGHEDQYIVVFEDTYEFTNGKTEQLNSEDINKMFGINLK